MAFVGRRQRLLLQAFDAGFRSFDVAPRNFFAVYRRLLADGETPPWVRLDGRHARSLPFVWWNEICRLAIWIIALRAM